MKRALPFLPLLGLSGLGHFLGNYLDGAGILPRGSRMFTDVFCILLLPWLVSAVLALLAKVKPPIRVLFFFGTLIAQPVLMFVFVPPGATAVTMGVAHRLRGEFPPDELRGCADHLRQKFRHGTLVVSAQGTNDHFIVDSSAVVVSDGELPSSLRGRFDRVFIQPDSVTGVERVYFSLSQGTGIVCDGRKYVRTFFVCSMADGVHAYRYQRL
jgi:hypothetical protein